MQRRAFIQLSALGAAGLALPAAASASSIRVQVEPYRHRIILRDAGGERIVGGLGSAPGRFNGPCAAAVGPHHLAVVDQGNYRVQVFANDGTLKATFGSYGDAPGRFLHPAGIAIADNGDIFVADTVKREVTRHAPDGTLLATIGGLDHPRSLAMGANGELHIGELGRSNHVRVVDTSGVTRRVYTIADGSRPYIVTRIGGRVIARERPDFVA